MQWSASRGSERGTEHLCQQSAFKNAGVFAIEGSSPVTETRCSGFFFFDNQYCHAVFRGSRAVTSEALSRRPLSSLSSGGDAIRTA